MLGLSAASRTPIVFSIRILGLAPQALCFRPLRGLRALCCRPLRGLGCWQPHAI